MPALGIGFNWPVCVDGYEVVKGNPKGGRRAREILIGESAPLEDEIRPRSDRYRDQDPVEINPFLFRRFATLGSKTDLYVAFANEYGLLHHHPDNQHLNTVSNWRREVHQLHEACELWARKYLASFSFDHMNKSLGTIAVVLRSERPGGRPVLKLVPHSLRSALWLQFCQFVSSDRHIRECDFCHDWFEVGGASGKRVDARFCSRDHKTAFHNLQKKAARK